MSKEQGCCDHHECCDKEHSHTCSCCGHECCKGHHQEEECHFTDRLLEMADEAWMELLHEKMKKHIAATCDQQLDELAKLVAATNHARWKNKMAAQKGCSDFKEKVKQFFACGDGSCDKD